MVLMPGKAGAADPNIGTTGTGCSRAAALCWDPLWPHPAPGEQPEVSSHHAASVPAMPTDCPLRTDRYIQSHHPWGSLHSLRDQI